MDLIKEIAPIHAANDTDDGKLDIKTPLSILFRGYRDKVRSRRIYGTEEYAYSGNRDISECLDGVGLTYMLEMYDGKRVGWWVIEGLTVDYHKDYYGEVDEEWHWTRMRRATIPEIIRCQIGAKWTNLLDDIKEGLFPWVLR
jgi:hypothetical protein